MITNFDRYARRDRKMREAKVEEAKKTLKHVLDEKDRRIAELEAALKAKDAEIAELEKALEDGDETQEQPEATGAADGEPSQDAPQGTATASQEEAPTHTPDAAEAPQKPARGGRKSK